MGINTFIERKGEKNTLFRYAGLSIISMWIFSLYTMVDGMFVGRGVGPEALAAVNLSMPFISLTFALSIMTSIGASTVISMFLGQKKIIEARDTFTHTIIFLGCTGFLICITGILFRYDLAYLLGARGDMVPLVVEYLSTVLFFNTFYLIAYALEVLIRVEGKPTVALITVVIAALTNIFLDYLLVIVFPLGLKGAAIATGSAQLIQGIILLSFFLKKDSILKFTTLKFSVRRILNLIKIGIPDSITELSVGIVVFLFNRAILNYYGSIGLVAFGIISYINNFILMTMIGLTQGMQPIVSYLNSKGKHKKRDEIFYLTLKSALVIGLSFFLLTIIFKGTIVGFFTTDLETSDFTLNALIIFAPSFILGGINIVFSGFFTAMEKTKEAGIIALFRGVILIPLFLKYLPAILDKESIWGTALMSEFLTVFIATFLYISYREKLPAFPGFLSSITNRFIFIKNK